MEGEASPSRYMCVLCQVTFSQLGTCNRHLRERRCQELKKGQEVPGPPPAKKRSRGEVRGVKYCIID